MRIEQRAQDLRFPGLLRGGVGGLEQVVDRGVRRAHEYVAGAGEDRGRVDPRQVDDVLVLRDGRRRSEEHTSELQSLMRSSYAVFCLKKKNTLQVMDTTNT